MRIRDNKGCIKGRHRKFHRPGFLFERQRTLKTRLYHLCHFTWLTASSTGAGVAIAQDGNPPKTAEKSTKYIQVWPSRVPLNLRYIVFDMFFVATDCTWLIFLGNNGFNTCQRYGSVGPWSKLGLDDSNHPMIYQNNPKHGRWSQHW